MNQQRRKIEFATKVAGSSYGMIELFFGAAIFIYVIENFLTTLFFQRGWGESASFTGIAMMLASFAACLCAYPYFRDYFRRKYGFATTKATNFKGNIKWAAVGLTISLLNSYVLQIDASAFLPFNIMITMFAVFSFIVWWQRYRGISNVFLYLAAVLLLAAFLPWTQVFAAFESTRVFRDYADFLGDVFLLMCAFLLVAAGLTDFAVLSQTLTPIDRKEEIYESV